MPDSSFSRKRISPYIDGDASGFTRLLITTASMPTRRRKGVGDDTILDEGLRHLSPGRGPREGRIYSPRPSRHHGHEAAPRLCESRSSRRDKASAISLSVEFRDEVVEPLQRFTISLVPLAKRDVVAVITTLELPLTRPLGRHRYLFPPQGRR